MSIRPVLYPQLDLDLLFRPPEGDQEGDYQEGSCFMLTDVVPVTVAVVIPSQEPNTSQGVGRLLGISWPQAGTDQKTQHFVVRQFMGRSRLRRDGASCRGLDNLVGGKTKLGLVGFFDRAAAVWPVTDLGVGSQCHSTQQ